MPPTTAPGCVVELYVQSFVKVVGQDTASLKVITIVDAFTTADTMVGTVPIPNVCVAANCGKLTVSCTAFVVVLAAVGAVYVSVSVAAEATRVTGAVPVFVV
jgi:hypothetical protein